jgi:hypothetical protein
MLTRELLKFKWIYVNGNVTLDNKRNGNSITIPIIYTDSLMRALIAFKNAYRIELMAHKQLMLTNSRLNTKVTKEIVKGLRLEIKNLKKKPVQLEITKNGTN